MKVQVQFCPSCLLLACGAATFLTASGASAGDDYRRTAYRKESTSKSALAAGTTAPVVAGAEECDTLLEGDCCNNAIIVPSLPFADSGDICQFTDNYDETCPDYPFPTPGYPDVVYSYSPTFTGTIDISLCADSAFDTKLYVYESVCGAYMSEGYLACDDDECSSPSFPVLPYISFLENVPVIANETYFIVVDAVYIGDPLPCQKTYTINIANDTGACCNRNNDTCTDNVLQSDCQGTLMNWYGNQVCVQLDPPCPPEVCGNDVREGIEECDGTDDVACPGECAVNCTCSGCGNDVKEGFEDCDGTDDAACPGECGTNCDCPVCGNGVVEGQEECDGPTADDACPFLCVPQGQPNECTCLSDCGNSFKEPDEECDGTDDAACPGQCDQFNCTCPPVCGDNIREGSEECDGTDDTACPGDCLVNCTCPPICGDNTREGSEECDGTDAAACPGQCEPFNCTCTVCGDNVWEFGEECDGTDSPMCPGNCQIDCTCMTGCGTGGACCIEEPLDGSPYCDDAACCETVCDVDSWCCDVRWDSICVGEAIDLCVSCAQCGNNDLQAGEQCDGTDDAACFGQCQVDCKCPSTAPAAMTSSPPSKVRYLSGGIPGASATAGGAMTAIEVELASLPRFRCSHDLTRGCNVGANCGAGNTCVEVTPFPHEGEVRYVQLIGTVQDSEALGTAMVAAALSCEPDYQDWESAVGANALHITGAEIVPKGVYHLRRLAASCMGNESGCAAKSEALMVVQVGWGDVNGDGALNVSDISNEVDVLKDLPSGRLAKYRAQVQPNAPDPTLKPSVQDLANVVDPNKGIGFPFPGPCPCPSSVACSPTTACTGTADCPSGGRRCVGGFCSLVDACGRCLP